ncbi:hypothetical protein D3C72_2224260 [compost metagenome]
MFDDLRFAELARRMGIDEIARARPRANQSTAFQQVISLEHRGGADPVGLAGIAHRRYTLTGAQDPGANQFGNVVGKFFVAFHHGSGQF